jgi:hypothetical protein
MICSLVIWAVPGLTRYYVDVKHINEMASFVVKEWQPLSVLKMFIIQTMDSRSFGRKMKNSLLFTIVWSGRLLVLCSCLSQEMLPLQ